MFTRDHFQTDVFDVRMLMFIYQHLFESQGNFGIVVRALLTLHSYFLPDVLFEPTQWFKFHKQWQ